MPNIIPSYTIDDALADLVSVLDLIDKNKKEWYKHEELMLFFNTLKERMIKTDKQNERYSR